MLRFCRSAVRPFRRSAGFAAATILILGTGIGVTTAMYSILYAVVLKPLPFSHPDRLVAVTGRPWDFVSLPTIQDWQQDSHAFQSLAAFTGWSPRIESSAGTGHANAALVSQNFLGTLGAAFLLGHDFAPIGQETDCFRQAIVTDAYWRRMGGGETLVSRPVLLDRQPYSVIGVLARSVALDDMDALDHPSILTRIGCDPSKSPGKRGDSSFRAIGRLLPGISIAQATAELHTRQRDLTRAYPNYCPPAFTPELLPLADYVTGTQSRTALFATLAACGLLLLIACANLMNLLLARNVRRRGELAVRVALGATPRRILRQLLAENAVLAVAGSALGLCVAAVLVQTFRHVTILHLPRLADASLNLPALAFAAVTTIAVALLLTSLPAARSTRPALLEELAHGATRSTSSSRGLRHAGRLLVVLQLAMALVLAATAGWMVSSVFLLLHQPLGFAPDHLLLASTDLRGPVPTNAPDPDKTLAVLHETLAQLGSMPGIVDVAASNDKPLGGRINRYDFCSDAHPEQCKQPSLQAPDVFQVTPGYFRTIGQQLDRGRSFNGADDGRSHVAIVNRALALQQWPGQNPIGHRVYSGELHAWAVVVGEVADVHSYSLERAPVPNLYLPEADGPDTSITFLVHTRADPERMDETIRRLLRAQPEVSVRYVESMPERMGHEVALRRFSMWVVAGFGILAMALAVVGTYALLAWEISTREREIGIRLALGSPRSAVISLLLFQEAKWIAGGVLLGLGGAALAGLLLRAEFYHARAASIPVLLTSSFLLVAPALAAIAIPARRASLLDPAVTLRQE